MFLRRYTRNKDGKTHTYYLLSVGRRGNFPAFSGGPAGGYASP
jgi:hypothetical protein